MITLKKQTFNLPAVADLLLIAHLFQWDQASHPRALVEQLVHQELTDEGGSTWVATRFQGETANGWGEGVRVFCTGGPRKGFDVTIPFDQIRNRESTVQAYVEDGQPVLTEDAKPKRVRKPKSVTPPETPATEKPKRVRKPKPVTAPQE